MNTSCIDTRQPTLEQCLISKYIFSLAKKKSLNLPYSTITFKEKNHCCICNSGVIASIKGTASHSAINANWEL